MITTITLLAACRRGVVPVWFTFLAAVPAIGAAEPTLVGHWPLAGDMRDRSGNGHDAANHGVDLAAAGRGGRPGTAAGFDGRGAWLQLPRPAGVASGTADFTFAAWIAPDDSGTDLPGSIASSFDFDRRQGWLLGIASHPGVTSSQANDRQLEFGVDADHDDASWIDHGRPGAALLIFALCSHDGSLYAGTCEADGVGHVYRWTEGRSWEDCGTPDRCNSVSALATCDGRLYAGTAKYRLAGSSLPESTNPHPGGKIYRYEGGREWTLVGELPDCQAVGGLVAYRNRLHASSLYKPAGFFRHEGGTDWTACPLPDGRRVESLTVWNGAIYASSYDAGHVFRYDGTTWEDLGRVGDETNTQTYGFQVYRGELHVATWASGKVFRYGGGSGWIDCGRLGEELEVMGMLVHNGRFYGGTLPLGEVHRYEGGRSWKRLIQLDTTPDVKYRRVWSMAQHRGRLFCGTLPSGRVWSFSSGTCVTDDRRLKPGWHHVAAIRQAGRLSLYVDGTLAASAPAAEAVENLQNEEVPLQLGRGSGDHFHGRMSDVRLYSGALSADAVRRLAGP
jgi:hypothetical protein